MNNSIKEKKLKEVKIQLKRAEIQKNILIKNIYKKYEIYLKIVRNTIFSSTEKGIFSLYTDRCLNDCNNSLHLIELNNFLNQNISSLINSKLPLLTIEQLKLGDINYSQNQLVKAKESKETVSLKVHHPVDLNYHDQLITQESIESNCNNNSNVYEYYDLSSEDEFLSLNSDKNSFLNSFTSENSIKSIEPEKYIMDYEFEIIEESKPNKLNHHEKLNSHQNLNNQYKDDSVSKDNLNIFETIDKAFGKFLFDLSFSINSELYEIKLIKENIAESTYKCLYNNNLIKHPYPFVIKFDLNSNNLSEYSNKYFDISLFNISKNLLEIFA